jgi:septum formation protein
MIHPRPLILASTSRYRRELLSRISQSFEVISPDVDEAVLPGEQPAQTAVRLALAKARAIAKDHPEALVIGSDQTATLDGITCIGKPGNHARAREQLLAASGRSVTFNTAVALLCLADGFEKVNLVPTLVRFRRLNEPQIESYLAREPAYDCAGAAKCEGLGIALLESIEGSDPTALIGLPLIALTGLLASAGAPVL